MGVGEAGFGRQVASWAKSQPQPHSTGELQIVSHTLESILMLGREAELSALTAVGLSLSVSLGEHKLPGNCSPARVQEHSSRRPRQLAKETCRCGLFELSTQQMGKGTWKPLRS